MRWLDITYRLSKTHETVKRDRIGRKIDALRGRNAKRVRVQGKTGDGQIILHDSTSNISSPICHLELVGRILERAGALCTKERVVSLMWMILV